MKTPLLSDREADSADYLTAAEILKGQLAGYPTDTYAHNGNEDLVAIPLRPGTPPMRRERPFRGRNLTTTRLAVHKLARIT